MKHLVGALVMAAVVSVGARAGVEFVPEKESARVLAEGTAINVEDSMAGRIDLQFLRRVATGVGDKDTRDGSASSFASTTRGWLVRFRPHGIPSLLPGVRHTLYARIRVEKRGAGKPVLQAGVYDLGRGGHAIGPSNLSLRTLAEGKCLFWGHHT